MHKYIFRRFKKSLKGRNFYSDLYLWQVTMWSFTMPAACINA